MKANKAPEKIWIAVYGKDLSYEWHSDSEFEEKDHNDIEYIRKDVFIEKMCNLLDRMIWEVTYEDLEGDSTQHHDKMEFIEDFKNYIKGE